MRTRGVLAIQPESRRWILIPEQRQQLDTFAALAAIALERVHYVDVAQDALVRMESERLRNSLLAALSHDLRTPLTALVGLSESLALSKPPLTPAQQELARGVARRSAAHEQAGHQSARHGAHPERRGQAQPAMAAARGSRRQRAARQRARSSAAHAGRDSARARPAAGAFRRGADRAGAVQPAGERGQVHAGRLAHRDRRGSRTRQFLRCRGVRQRPRPAGRAAKKRSSRNSRAANANRRRPASAWGWRSAARSSKRTAARIARRHAPDGGARFIFTLPLGTPPAMPDMDEATAASRTPHHE